MADYRILYVSVPLGRGVPRSYQNTIVDAPSQEAVVAMFRAVMDGPETHITHVELVDGSRIGVEADGYPPTSYAELQAIAESRIDGISS